MIKKIFNKIYMIIYWFHYFFKNGFNKKIILLNTPAHGNLGDQAITLAELRYFSDNFSLEVLEINSYEIDKYMDIWSHFVRKKDLIIINGGGYLGNLWLNEEIRCRKIISTFKSNKIVIFPQTIYYTDDEIGLCELNNSKEIYQSHKNITLFLRDKNSYQFAFDNFVIKKIYLVPDMVTYLNYSQLENKSRNGILFCLRKDKEKLIDDNIINEIIIFIEKKGFHYKCTDTVINENINTNNREYYVECKLNEFKEAELVITDRLHGMLFAAITGTPCIAFDNISKKVSGVYEWINYLNYIYIINYEKNTFKLVFNEVYSLIGKNNTYKPPIDDLKKINEILY